MVDRDGLPPLLEKSLPPAESSIGPDYDGMGTKNARGGGSLQMGVAPSGKSAELWGQSAESMISCTPMRHAGSAGPSSSPP